MRRTKPEDYDPCADPNARRPGCTRPQLERLRFWNGRFLVARDLRDQQEDLIRRLEYHQSFAHGEGVLCGFEIRKHPREQCRDRYLVVESGMAYDCCGRTLWMPDCRVVEIPRPKGEEEKEEDEKPDDSAKYPDDQDKKDPQEKKEEQTKYEQQAKQEQQAKYGPVFNGWLDPDYDREHDRDQDNDHDHDHDDDYDHDHDYDHEPDHEPENDDDHDDDDRSHWRRRDPQWFIVACHVECKTDPVPALYADDLCEPMREEHGRVREDVAIRVVPASEISDACWPRYRPVTEIDCRQEIDDDCRHPLGEAPPCFRDCACGDCVVLAAVWWDPRKKRLRFSTRHRKVLAPPVNLTRITGLNWPHGGELSTQELLEEHRGRLIVRFSRALRPANKLRNGINAMTFTVSFLGATRSYEQIIPPEPDETKGRRRTPRLSRNRRCAIFDIDPDMLRGRFGYGGAYIHVRLLCDFLIDCHGRAVSGAHLAGDASGRGSGNGVQGGIFESWFYLRNAGRGDMR